jgi:hypothetical protein
VDDVKDDNGALLAGWCGGGEPRAIVPYRSAVLLSSLGESSCCFASLLVALLPVVVMMVLDDEAALWSRVMRAE